MWNETEDHYLRRDLRTLARNYLHTEDSYADMVTGKLYETFKKLYKTPKEIEELRWKEIQEAGWSF